MKTGVAERVVETRDARDPPEPAGEGSEEEEREDERRDQEGRVREDVVQDPPGDSLCDVERPHERSILVCRAIVASETATAASTAAMPHPSTSASGSQPMMIKLRTPSKRYETGLTVAAVRN